MLSLIDLNRLRGIARVLSRLGMYISDFVLLMSLINNMRGHKLSKLNKTKRTSRYLESGNTGKGQRISYWEIPGKTNQIESRKGRY